MHQLFVLYEDATGYALFRTTEFEEIATFLPQVQDSILDVSKFRSVVFLVAFQQFENWREGLENVKCISNGVLHKTLQLFLENNVPKSKKSKQSVMLGVQDPDLATHISDTLGINCSTSGAVTEIIRGIRFHFRKLLKAFNDETIISKTKLSMSHHYSRSVVNLTTNKVDNMIIHGLSVVDQLKQNVNTLISRVRKLYDCHFPELFKIVTDPNQYIMCIKEIKNRKNLPVDIDTTLLSIVGDEDKVQNILNSAQNSMGMEVSEEDIENINVLIEQIVSLIKQQDSQTEYVKSKMHVVAPSLGNLMGEMAGARLIAEAGGLIGLSKVPSSTMQLFGAKKSLFRSLKSKDGPLKFADITKSSFIGKDSRITKAHTSRFLANKCSLAVRSDCFSIKPTGAHGEELKQEVQDHVKFLEKGKISGVIHKKSRRKRRKGRKKNLNKISEISQMEVER